MIGDFRHALLRHMEEHGTAISDLVAATGVSRDVINKLKAREKSSTTVENGMLIAAFYGKTVNQFVSMQETTEADIIASLFGMLEPRERQLLAKQMRDHLAARAQKQP